MCDIIIIIDPLPVETVGMQPEVDFCKTGNWKQHHFSLRLI